MLLQDLGQIRIPICALQARIIHDLQCQILSRLQEEWHILRRQFCRAFETIP